MLKKISLALLKISLALLISFLVSSGVAQAYDLPKLKPDKKITKTTEQKKSPLLKSDWKSTKLFEEQIKARLASGDKLAPNDPARSPTDKNYIFIAFYNDAPFFLDRYSIKVKTNSNGEKVWEQQIFPISPKYSPQNATATRQSFCLSGGKFFNSKKPKDKNALSAVTNEADKIFLEECFRVGYYFAFGEEVQSS